MGSDAPTSSGEGQRSGAQPTFLGHRRRAQLEELRRAYTRLFLVGCVAWPAFALHDVASTLLTGRAHALPWVLGLRAAGEAVALPCFFLVRSGRASLRQTAFVDYLLFTLGGALLGLMTIALGGLTSRYSQGVLIFVFARCTVFPLPWRRAWPVPLATVCAYPAALAAAALLSAPVRAQWADRAAVGGLADNMLFVVAGTAVGIFASHLIDHAQRQVREARQLGSYRLKARIGRGSTGDVWLARQVPLERDVALKVLRDQSWRSEEAIKRFTREARAASQLAHPNTIRVHDFGASDDGVLFIAMELLDGMDVEALVGASGPLPAARVIHLARQACGSLAEAHGRGILHRDVKPANLFVTRVGDRYDVVKVLDFGVARLRTSSETLTEVGAIFGTPDTMSPETCAGDPVDARSDVYSLGATLYFMLTGAPLFPDRTVAEVLSMHVSRAPDPPSSRVRDVPADLEQVVMRCLEKSPDDRFASVRELDEALAACEAAGHWTPADASSWWAERRGSLARLKAS